MPLLRAKLSPIRRNDSPNAIISSSWQRSARWAPAIVQSDIGVAPASGRRKPTQRRDQVDGRGHRPDQQSRVRIVTVPPMIQIAPLIADHTNSCA